MMKAWGTKLRERFYKLRRTATIKSKLILINMIVAILPVVAFGILITRVYNDSINDRTRKSVDDSSMIIADRITRVRKDAENCSNYLTVNINKVIEEQKSGSKMSLATQKAINNELYVAKIVFDEIESIAFISNDSKIFLSDNTLKTNEDKLLASEQLQVLQKTSGKSIWFPCETREFLVTDFSKPVLTLGKKVIRIESGDTLGYLFLNVDISAIEKNLKNQLINYWVLDENDTVISYAIESAYLDEETGKQLLNQGNMQTRNNRIQGAFGRQYYISYYNIDDYGWELIGITDLDEFNVEAKNILYLIILISVVTILFELLLSNYLTRIITTPLLKLKNGAEEIAAGNMKLRFHFKSEDEIGLLGKSFNYMTEKVEELLLKVDYEARKKREYELSLLHQQVKPHFLYNSLDIIIKLSEMEKNREARRAVKKLADYYRNSLSDSKEIITIEQEIKIVEDYLELQRIRYSNLFTYEVQVEETVLLMSIPKLTLQPLVENAIYHGLKYRNESGSIRIVGKRTNHYTILSVIDNGVGMNEVTLKKLLHNKPEGHFGVYSVNHRIKLFFGEEYGVKVESEEGKGTVIDVLLPIKEFKGDSDYDKDNDC